MCLIQPIPIYWAASPNPPEYLEFLVCTVVILRGVIDFQSLTALSRGLCTGNAFNKWLVMNWIHPWYVWLLASWVNLRASVLKIKIAIAKFFFFFWNSNKVILYFERIWKISDRSSFLANIHLLSRPTSWLPRIRCMILNKFQKDTSPSFIIWEMCTHRGYNSTYFIELLCFNICLLLSTVPGIEY